MITDLHFLEFFNGRIRQVSRTEENGASFASLKSALGISGLCFHRDFIFVKVDVSCIVNILGELGGAIQKLFHS